jgi:uncharacterized protein (DUF1330 family)
MPAYFIVLVDKTTDQSEIEEYRRLAMPSFAGRTFKFLTKPDCDVIPLEGDEVDVVVMIEFPSVAEARDWYRSDIYQNAVGHRWKAAKSRAVIVEQCK